MCWLGRLDSNQGMPESKSGALPLGYAPTRAPYSGGTAAVQRKPARWGATRPLHFAVAVDHLPLDARIGHLVGGVDVPDFGQVLRRVGLEQRLELAHVVARSGRVSIKASPAKR